MKPDALWPAYNIIERETSMTEQKRRFEDQLPNERLDWDRGGEPSGDPIRVERQQALLNCAAALLKAERAESTAVAFPNTDPAQYVMIGTADEILGLLPVPGATDGLLRAKIRDIVTLLIERQDVDHLLDDPDLVRLVSALTAMAVRVSGASTAAAPAAGQAGLASQITDTDSAREYLVKFSEQHFSDKTFHRYIRNDQGNRQGLAGDFAWQLAKALESMSAPVAADTEQAKEQGQ